MIMRIWRTGVDPNRVEEYLSFARNQSLRCSKRTMERGSFAAGVHMIFALALFRFCSAVQRNTRQYLDMSRHVGKQA
jgi:hypothetical protein